MRIIFTRDGDGRPLPDHHAGPYEVEHVPAVGDTVMVAGRACAVAARHWLFESTPVSCDLLVTWTE